MKIIKTVIMIRSKLVCFSNEDTKNSVKEKLGDPDDLGGFLGKRKIPLIYKYEEIEFHFNKDDSLLMIFKEEKKEDIVTLCIDFRKTY